MARLQRPMPPLCPVTALAFLRLRGRLCVLAGEDGWLCVYDAEGGQDGEGGEEERENKREGEAEESRRAEEAGRSLGRRCRGRLRVFAEQAIQGCHVREREDEADEADEMDDESVLVWGGRQVALVARQRIEQAVEESSSDDSDDSDDSKRGIRRARAADWIYDGLLKTTTTTTTTTTNTTTSILGALVTAHNEVLPFWVAADGTLAWGPGLSPSRPVLYAAKLAWQEVGQDGPSLLVAAGTVFGEIVVWTCVLASGRTEVRHVLAGHEGSIFGVALSPAWGGEGEEEGEGRKGEGRKGEGRRGEERRGHHRHRILVSCSDDRTIRAWLVEDETCSPSSSPTSFRLEAPRETGFVNALAPLPAAAAAAPAPAPPPPSEAVAVVMGHASRIWHVKFNSAWRDEGVAQTTRKSISLFSFGEDATSQEWRLVLDQGHADHAAAYRGRFLHVQTFSGHAGKNIWAAAVLAASKRPERPERPESRRPEALVATGAADGKICLHRGRGLAVTKETDETDETDETEDEDCPAFTVPFNTAATPLKKSRPELFNSYAFLSSHQLLAATSHGRLFLAEKSTSTTTSNHGWTWSPVTGSPDSASALQGYNVVRAPGHEDGLAVVGSARGQLFVYTAESGRLWEMSTRLSGKVEDVFFLAGRDERDEKDQKTRHLHLVVSLLARNEIALLDVVVSSALVSERCLWLTLPSSTPITAAGRCSGHLVLGSRKGQLLLYRPTPGSAGLQGLQEAAAPLPFHLVSDIQAAKSDAILSIVPLPPRPGHAPASCPSFVATARDGTFRIFSILAQGTGDSRSLHLQHETSPPFGPIVRDAWFLSGSSSSNNDNDDDDDDDDNHPSTSLVLCGFLSTRFVVWDETRQQQLAAIECGGVHRTHAYRLDARTGHVQFAFTRSSRLHLSSSPSSPLSRMIKPGGHGREIRAVSSSSSSSSKKNKKNNKNSCLLATGGEDTVIRLWQTSEAADSRRCVSVLKRHNTGLHALAWLGDRYLVSAAGAEELFVWRVTRLTDSAYNGLAVVCLSAYPDRVGDDKTLRITDVAVSGEEAEKEIETENAIITVTLSNSVLKTYRFFFDAHHGNKQTAWHLLATGRYTGACPMHVRHLRLEGVLLVLAAFADGHLSVWRAAAADPVDGHPDVQEYKEYSLLAQTQAHHNAIKSLDLCRLPRPPVLRSQDSSTEEEDRWAIVTGGDDSAMAVTRMSIRGQGSDVACVFDTTYRLSGAHAAAVTGMCIVATDEDKAVPEAVSRLTAVSCSNDQRVKTWRVSLGQGPVQVELLDDQPSAVADPADLTRLPHAEGKPSVVVVGMGMETWSLERGLDI